MSFLVSKKVMGSVALAAAVAALILYRSMTTVPTESLETVRFVSAAPEAELAVEFSGNAVTLRGPGFGPVTLKEAETASGRRFEDRTTGLTFWYEGGVGTLYERGAIIFTGTDAAALPAAPEPTESVLAEQLLNVTWQWRETIMSDGTRVAPQRAPDFLLSLKDGNVSGTTDCNNFSGTFTLEGATLSIGPLRMTRMYCADSKEQAFASVLQGATTVLFNLEGNLVLLLKDDAGSVFFERATTTLQL